MAGFLDRPDYYTTINLTVLDALVGGDTSIITELSLEAIEEMKSYLVSRYDVTAIFAAVGSARNKTVLMYCKDIALYHLYSYNTLTVIPETRVNRYNKALLWLEHVSEQKVNPYGLQLSTNSLVRAGGNEKRINQQQ